MYRLALGHDYLPVTGTKVRERVRMEQLKGHEMASPSTVDHDGCVRLEQGVSRNGQGKVTQARIRVLLLHEVLDLYFGSKDEES